MTRKLVNAYFECNFGVILNSYREPNVGSSECKVTHFPSFIDYDGVNNFVETKQLTLRQSPMTLRGAKTAPLTAIY